MNFLVDNKKYTVGNIFYNDCPNKKDIIEIPILIPFDKINQMDLPENKGIEIFIFDIENVKYKCYMNHAFDDLKEFFNFFKLNSIDEIKKFFEIKKTKISFFSKFQKKDPVKFIEYNGLQYFPLEYYNGVQSDLNVDIIGNIEVFIFTNHTNKILIFEILNENSLTIYNGEEILSYSEA